MTNRFNDYPHQRFDALSGDFIRTLMKIHDVTAEELAAVNGISTERVNYLRSVGVPAGLASWEIFWMIEDTVIHNNMYPCGICKM